MMMAVNSIQSKELAEKKMQLDDDYFRQIFEKFNQAKDKKTFCDVKLVADDGTRISAHRLVLSSASDYFATMFTGPLKESKETEIALHDIPGDVLQNLIQICYTGVIEVGADDVECILKNSVMYQFSGIVKKCSDFLTDQLRPSNSLGVALLADHLSLKELAQTAWSCACANFMNVNQNEEFMELSHIELTKLLESEDLVVNNEEDVFNCVEAWVKHNSPERIKYIVNLLPHIRLPLIKQQFLSERVSPFCNLVPQDSLTQCLQLLINAFKYQWVPLLTHPEQIVKPRNSLIRLLLISNLNNIEIYDSLKDEWTILKFDAIPFNKPLLNNSSFAIMVNKLYIIGGKDSNGYVASRVECIDFNKMTSILLPSLNEGRYNSSAAVVNGIVYCIGGYCYNGPKKTVERYDQNTCTWEVLAPMNIGRYGAAVSAIENKIYIVGGDTGNGYTSSMLCYYDTQTNIWRDCAPMSKSYSQIGAGAINGLIYAIGGNNLRLQNTNTLAVERYDPHLNKWEQLANIPNIYYYWSVAVLENRLIIASCNGGSYKKVQQYNPDENKWTTLTSFNAETGREGFAIIPVSERFVNLK